MNHKIRIGTRASELALWQANLVYQQLTAQGYACELVPITSEGDQNLVTPLYEMGVQGIFTKTLDIALLKQDIDIAVHSLKDVPTGMAKGLTPLATLSRASNLDILVPPPTTTFTHQADFSYIIATSSTRRRAQWLHKYPNSTMEGLRGNVNTRLQKVAASQWHGAIFAAAGLERINLRPANAIDLDWMLPAPAQGAIVIVGRENDAFVAEACATLHHEPTGKCVQVEREFLRALMGGCTTPISGLATTDGNYISFTGQIMSLDGADEATVALTMDADQSHMLGIAAAELIMQQGGKEIMEKINNVR